MLMERTGSASPFEALDIRLLKAALVLILCLLGWAKWLAYDVQWEQLIDHSPLLGWLHDCFGTSGEGRVLACMEWAVALLLLAGFRSPLSAVLGALSASGMFALMLTLIMSAPETWEPAGPLAGQAMPFLIKDLALLAVSVVLLRHALRHGLREPDIARE